MSRNSPFVIVFWALVILMTLAAAGLTWLAAYGLLGIDAPPAALVPFFILVLIYICIVAPVVYQDASRRGLDPWLWASVATFLPYLLGVILYLVRRSNGARGCVACGRERPAQLAVCPYCGVGDDLHCPQCNQPIAGDWQVCPFCRHQLG